MKALTFLFSLFSLTVFAQTGINTRNPNSNTALEINSPSNNKGLLISTVALTSAILPAPLSSHIEGMMVYNSATAGTFPNHVTPGLYYNNGTSWIKLQNDIALGTIKQSFETNDHDGWYKLDGRALSSMSTASQLKANSIGINFSLPDARDRFLKGRTAESPFATGGSNSITMLQANFPNVTYTGTTDPSGAHTHDIVDGGNTVYYSSVVLGIVSRTFYTSATLTTRNTGTNSSTHTHNITIPTGGGNSPFSNIPLSLIVQSFIYLGI